MHQIIIAVRLVIVSDYKVQVERATYVIVVGLAIIRESHIFCINPSTRNR